MTIRAFDRFAVPFNRGMDFGTPARDIVDKNGGSGYMNGENIRVDSTERLAPRKGYTRRDVSSNGLTYSERGPVRMVTSYNGSLLFAADGGLFHTEQADPIAGLPVGTSDSESYWSATELGLNDARRLYIATGLGSQIYVWNGTIAKPLIDTTIETVAPNFRAVTIGPLGEEVSLGTITAIRGKQVAQHGNRLFVAGASLSFNVGTDVFLPLIASDLSNSLYDDARGYGNQFANIRSNYEPFDEPVEAIASLFPGLLVLGRTKSWLITGEFGVDHRKMPLPIPGIRAPRTLSISPNRIAYYLSQRGLVATDGSSYNILSKDETQEYLDGVLGNFPESYASGVWLESGRRYWLAAATPTNKTSPASNEVMEFDVEMNRLHRYTGLDITALAEFQGNPWWGDSRGRIWNGDTGNADMEQPAFTEKDQPWIVDSYIEDNGPILAPWKFGLMVFPDALSNSQFWDYLSYNEDDEVWEVIGGANNAQRIRVYLDVQGAPGWNGADPNGVGNGMHPFKGHRPNPNETRLTGTPVHIGLALNTPILASGAFIDGETQYYFIDIDTRDSWGLGGLLFTKMIDNAPVQMPTAQVMIGQVNARADVATSAAKLLSCKFWKEIELLTVQGGGFLNLMHWGGNNAELGDLVAGQLHHLRIGDIESNTFTQIGDMPLYLADSRVNPQLALNDWNHVFLRLQILWLAYQNRSPIQIEQIALFYQERKNRHARLGGSSYVGF